MFFPGHTSFSWAFLVWISQSIGSIKIIIINIILLFIGVALQRGRTAYKSMDKEKKSQVQPLSQQTMDFYFLMMGTFRPALRFTFLFFRWSLVSFYTDPNWWPSVAIWMSWPLQQYKGGNNGFVYLGKTCIFCEKKKCPYNTWSRSSVE